MGLPRQAVTRTIFRGRARRRAAGGRSGSGRRLGTITARAAVGRSDTGAAALGASGRLSTGRGRHRGAVRGVWAGPHTCRRTAKQGRSITRLGRCWAVAICPDVPAGTEGRLCLAVGPAMSRGAGGSVACRLPWAYSLARKDGAKSGRSICMKGDDGPRRSPYDGWCSGGRPWGSPLRL